jgi:hypothetical protein
MCALPSQSALPWITRLLHVTATSNSVCALLTVCTANQYISVQPTDTSNLVCAAYTVCAAGSFVFPHSHL